MIDPAADRGVRLWKSYAIKLKLVFTLLNLLFSRLNKIMRSILTLVDELVEDTTKL